MSDAGPPMWVVYDHPTDLPAFIVVRKQTAQRDGTIAFDQRAYCFHELGTARRWLEGQGLYRLSRDPRDDPKIVEIWL